MLKPSFSSIGEFPAFVVTCLHRSGRTPAHLHFGWVAMGGKTYQLMGLDSRTRNVWPRAYTALVNVLNVERDLLEGQLVKIARVEPLRP